MKWWIAICSCLIVAGLLLQLGAPLIPVAVGLVLGAFLVWERNRRGAAKR
jgi:hypothetical protein